MNKNVSNYWRITLVFYLAFSFSSFSQTEIDSENFESGSFSGAIWNDGGSKCKIKDDNKLSGTYSVELKDNESSSVTYTDDIDITTYNSITIQFDFKTRKFDSGEDFFIEFSDDGGSTWDNTPILKYVKGTDFNNDIIYSNVTATANNSTYNFTASSRFRFRCDASEGDEKIYIDDIIITGNGSSGSGSGSSSGSSVSIDFEDFEVGSFPYGIWQDGGDNCLMTYYYAISGSYSPYLRDDTSSSVMYTSDLDFTAYDYVTIEFDYSTWNFDTGEDFFIEFSDDGGATWDSTSISRYEMDTDFVNYVTYTDVIETVDSSIYNFTSNSRLRFRSNCSSSNEDVTFDNIEIIGYQNSGGSSSGTDFDNDGIADSVDLDDDNDGILDHVECENFLVDSGFDNKTGLSYGNNIGEDISPWILIGGDQANIVKVDGVGGYDYGNGGPFEDANSVTGNGEDQYYLDIASGSNDFYQSFTVSHDALLSYGGYFSSRDGRTGTAQLRIFTGSSGSSGTLVADSGSFSVSPTSGDSSNTPWQLFEDTVSVTAGIYSFVVSMDNDMNFDEGYAGACLDRDGDGAYDYLDLDSDNDGCNDVVESGGTDSNSDGILDGSGFDSNGQVTGGSGGYNGLSGNEIIATELTVSTTPSSQTVSAGSAASFEVVASARNTIVFSSGTPDYSEANSSSSDSGINYQWYLGDPSSGGVALTASGVYSNVNTSQLNISDVTGLDSNVYYVVITHDDNVCIEEVNSATLTVSVDSCNAVASGNVDTDGDGISDVCDVDDDNDGLLDCIEKGIVNGTITELFNLSGTASEISSTEFQLTNAAKSQAGAATIVDRINFNNSFSFSFDAYLGDSDGGADGIAIIFHDDPSGASAVGTVGEGIGASGIQNGIVLELDTYDNGSTRGDISNDHGMIWDSDNQSGAGLLTTATDLGNLEDDSWHTVTINWDANTNTINYSVDSNLAASYTGDLINNFFGGNNLVFFGFSASTGDAFNNQSIRFNSVCDIPLFIDTDNDGIANSLDLDSDNDGIPDNIEGQTTLGYLLPSGTVNTSGNYKGLWDNYGNGITPEDTDSDLTPDYIDTNSDNDVYGDAQENGMTNSNSTLDSDNDGLVNPYETNGVNDSHWDVNEDIEDPTDLSVLPDVDSDLNSGGDLDYRDVLSVSYPSSASIDFDGVDDYLSGNSILDGLGDVTIMAWIKVDAENAGVSNVTIVGEDTACRLYVKDGDEVMFSVRTSAGISKSISGGVINYNEWHHVTGVYSGTTGEQIIYLDGEVIITDTNANQIGATIDPSSNWTGNFEVGRISSAISDRQYFNGEIDEIRAFNIALTASQIQAMVYQEIEKNTSKVRGAIIPKDIIDIDTKATVAWSNLKAYYPMTGITSNKILDYSDNDNELTIYNISTVQQQTAPMPYTTLSDGDWSSESAWVYGDLWDIENINSVSDYGIVKISNNIKTSNSHTHVGLIIDEGKKLTVNGDNLIKNTMYLELNGDLDLMSDSQLIQTQTSDLVTSESGKVLRRQEGTSSAYWYNYWGAPVGVTGVTTLSDNNAATNNTNNSSFKLDLLKDGTGFNMQFTSNYTGNGSISKFWLYAYKNAVTYWDWSKLSTSTDIKSGEGYIQKGTGIPASDQQYIFEGKPNNGTILVDVIDKGGEGSVSNVSKTEYLLGNPYASAIDIHQFIDDNAGVIGGTIQLWQQWSGTSHHLKDYNGGYAQVNKSGSIRAYQFTGTIAGGHTDSQDGTIVPTRYLSVGQGFITEIVANGTVEFNNGQRVFIKEADADGSYGNGSVFSKKIDGKVTTKSTTSRIVSNEMKKIRLEFESVSGPAAHRELLLGFSKDTSDEYDYGYDAENPEVNNNDLHLGLNGKEFNIQAYSEISSDKIIPLTFKSSAENSFEIKISEKINISEDQEIYLKDNITGTYFDLTDGASYSFSSDQGKFNTRFEIVFQSEQQSLSVEEISKDSNFVYYQSNRRKLFGKKLKSSIKRLALVNMLGQTVMELQDVSQEALNNGIDIPQVSTGAYIAYFKSEDNEVFSKKMIIN